MATIEERSFKAYPEKICTDFSVDQISKKVTGEEIFDGNGDYRVGYIKCAEEYESLPKIRGWVARDSVEDSFCGTGLILHDSKPTRTGGEWSSMTIVMHLPSKMFPEITWESEPVEVELLIRKV